MSAKYTLSICHSLNDIAADEWNALANPDAIPFDPFISYDFFHALETSGSAVMETGWSPHHLLLKDEKRSTVGIMPLYLKSHSQGEYVFDHGWAHGFEIAGGRYFPKLLTGVPFTPVTGRRIFAGSAKNSEEIQSLLLEGALQIVEQNHISSLHINFIPSSLVPLVEDKDFLIRTDTQFHWVNQGYETFDDFLDGLSSRKRKAIKRERRIALKDGLEIEWVNGENLEDRHWDVFFSFYQDTGLRKWGMPYLTRAFFDEIGKTLSNYIVLIFAKFEGRYIAGALNFKGSETLFGRYWGSLEHHDCLHFEICYYQAIEYALAHGLLSVEAGAQGEHKLARGYAPTSTYSAHFIAHAEFKEAVKGFLVDEGCYKNIRDEVLSAHLPYKKDA